MIGFLDRDRMQQRPFERGERLTQQLLMFSRRQVLHPETLNLNRLLREFEGMMRRAVGSFVLIG